MLHRDGTVTCDYCKKPAELAWVGRYWRWQCIPCDAWVSAHVTSPTKKPTGRLANATLRHLRHLAQCDFTPMWQAQLSRRIMLGDEAKNVRGEAFKWLAKELGIEPHECHFAQFDDQMCKRVMVICAPFIPPFAKGNQP